MAVIITVIITKNWGFLGNPDPQLAGQDDLRARDQYCSCGESE